MVLGPRPAEISFPFGAARTAMARIDALLDDLETLSRAHEDVTTLAPRDFGGSSRNAFEALFGVMLTDLANERSLLAAQRDELETLVAQAERLQAQRRDEIAAWERRRERWLEEQAEAS